MTHASSDTHQGDACGLVDEFRAGHRHPVEEMQASIAAAEANKKAGLNAFSFIDPERALAAAAVVSRWP
jgi:aspartyl-tRNA(Asn)/glutamyl-tRNA(Gln) amidotransferase subunit A